MLVIAPAIKMWRRATRIGTAPEKGKSQSGGTEIYVHKNLAGRPDSGPKKWRYLLSRRLSKNVVLPDSKG